MLTCTDELVSSHLKLVFIYLACSLATRTATIWGFNHHVHSQTNTTRQLVSASHNRKMENFHLRNYFILT